MRETTHGLSFSYCDVAGNELRCKLRALAPPDEDGKPQQDRHWWAKGTEPIGPYGAEWLDTAFQAGWLVLAEGESDALTLRFHHIPGVGIPGADRARVLSAEHLDSLETIYVVNEKDQGGATVVRGVTDRLSELGFVGKVFEIRMPEGFKDPSDLHIDDPERFQERFAECLTNALPLEIAANKPDLPDSPDAAREKSEWGPPLLLGSQPNVPPFPVEVFPEPLQQFIDEAAAALPCPPDYLAVPLLVTAGGMIGASRALAIKAKHIQRAALYAAVVGGPGTAKTPSLEAVVDPVHDIEEEAHAQWELAMEQYEVDLEDYEQRKKEARKNNEELPQKPVKPLLLRLTVDDATAEAMAPILKENPRGVVMIADELIGWVQRMNAYRDSGKGADRQFWLSAWSGKTATIDRKKSHELGPIRIHKPFVGVVGGLVPDNLTILRGDQHRQRGKNDGFLDRLLLSYPVELSATEENWADISEETSQRLAAVYAHLRTLQMVPIKEGEVARSWRPFLVHLTHEGKAVWQMFTRQHAAERNADDFPSCLIGPWSKFRGYCGRLALVIHFLRWACGEIESDTADVDGESMTRAVRLIDYFKAHARKVYAVIDADPRIADARRLLDWIVREGQTEFKRWEAHKDLQSDSRFPTPDALDKPLELLQQHQVIREKVTSDRNGRGRKPAPVFEVNSLVHRRENRVNRGNSPPTSAVIDSPAATTRNIPDLPDLPDGAGEVVPAFEEDDA